MKSFTTLGLIVTVFLVSLILGAALALGFTYFTKTVGLFLWNNIHPLPFLVSLLALWLVFTITDTMPEIGRATRVIAIVCFTAFGAMVPILINVFHDYSTPILGLEVTRIITHGGTAGLVIVYGFMMYVADRVKKDQINYERYKRKNSRITT